MTITAAQIYLLNHMNACAAKVQLGTLIANAEAITADEIALANGKILAGNGSGVAAAVTPSGDVTMTNAGVFAIGAGKVTEAMLAASSTAGLQTRRIAYGVLNPTATAGDRTIAAHALGATIPINSFVTGFWYWVETTCTSSTDAATIALSIEGANDCVSAIAISNGGNPWDTTALPVEGIPKIETTSTFLKTTAARALTATVAVEVLLLGKVHVWAEYFTYS